MRSGASSGSSSRSTLFLIGVLVVGLTGCGGSDEPSTTSAATEQDLQAQDAQAESTALAAQTAMEVYATENNGTYAGADVPALEQIEPTLRGTSIDLSSGSSTYGIAVESESGIVFTVARQANGAFQFECSDPGTGGCPPAGDWNQ